MIIVKETHWGTENVISFFENENLTTGNRISGPCDIYDDGMQYWWPGSNKAYNNLDNNGIRKINGEPE